MCERLSRIKTASRRIRLSFAQLSSAWLEVLGIASTKMTFEMATPDEAAKAIQLLNGHEVDGRTIKVSEVRSQERSMGRGGFDRSGGHHGRDQFNRGGSKSGLGRRSGLRGGG
jgi:hypothetical protein